MKQVRVTVNGALHELKVKPWETLLTLLRDELGLTGTKEGCGLGECGACTVILDGKAVNSCLVLAAEADGAQITTIEGLSGGDGLDPLQAAFVEHGGMQCGFCTPGMIMSAKVLLDEIPSPTAAEIRKGMAGHVCRCTGYTKIVESIASAAKYTGDK